MLKGNGLVFALLKVAPGGNGVEIRGYKWSLFPSKPVSRFQDGGMIAIQRLNQRLVMAVCWLVVLKITTQ